MLSTKYNIRNKSDVQKYNKTLSSQLANVDLNLK